jgi:hypothetical protein
MLGWLPTLPVVWIALVVLVGMGLLAVAIHVVVAHFAEGNRAAALSAVSPAMLPPMGILFALFVGFLAVGVWGNVDRAEEAVNTEASALRAVVLLSDDLPATDRTRMRALIRRQIQTAVDEEWPAMEDQRASLTAIPAPLSDALHLAFALRPREEGEAVSQREIVASIQDALDARRQRIIVSESGINAVKWLGLVALAALTLVTVALIHTGNRTSARIAIAVFTVAEAVVITMLVAQDQPFTGQLGLTPDVLEQVFPRVS